MHALCRDACASALTPATSKSLVELYKCSSNKTCSLFFKMEPIAFSSQWSDDQRLAAEGERGSTDGFRSNTTLMSEPHTNATTANFDSDLPRAVPAQGDMVPQVDTNEGAEATEVSTTAASPAAEDCDKSEGVEPAICHETAQDEPTRTDPNVTEHMGDEHTEAGVTESDPAASTEAEKEPAHDEQAITDEPPPNEKAAEERTPFNAIEQSTSGAGIDDDNGTKEEAKVKKEAESNETPQREDPTGAQASATQESEQQLSMDDMGQDAKLEETQNNRPNREVVAESKASSTKTASIASEDNADDGEDNNSDDDDDSGSDSEVAKNDVNGNDSAEKEGENINDNEEKSPESCAVSSIPSSENLESSTIKFNLTPHKINMMRSSDFQGSQGTSNDKAQRFAKIKNVPELSKSSEGERNASQFFLLDHGKQNSPSAISSNVHAEKQSIDEDAKIIDEYTYNAIIDYALAKYKAKIYPCNSKNVFSSIISNIQGFQEKRPQLNNTGVSKRLEQIRKSNDKIQKEVAKLRVLIEKLK